MNLNLFTTKSQEALQQAQILVQANGQQQIENEHIFTALLEVDENVTPFILKKVNVNIEIFRQTLNAVIESFPKVSGGQSVCRATPEQCSTKHNSLLKK